MNYNYNYNADEKLSKQAHLVANNNNNNNNNNVMLLWCGVGRNKQFNCCAV
jgi:hypothetical protein